MAGSRAAGFAGDAFVIESQLPKSSLGPALGIDLRRLTDEQHPGARAEEADGTFGGDPGCAEEPGRHHIEGIGQLRRPSQFLGPSLNDPSGRRGGPTFDRGPQEFATTVLGIKQRHRQIGSNHQQRDAGEPAPGTKVQDIRVHRDRISERASIGQVDFGIGISDEAEFDRTFDMSDERVPKLAIDWGVRISAHQGNSTRC